MQVKTSVMKIANDFCLWRLCSQIRSENKIVLLKFLSIQVMSATCIVSSFATFFFLHLFVFVYSYSFSYKMLLNQYLLLGWGQNRCSWHYVLITLFFRAKERCESKGIQFESQLTWHHLKSSSNLSLGLGNRVSSFCLTGQTLPQRVM